LYKAAAIFLNLALFTCPIARARSSITSLSVLPDALASLTHQVNGKRAVSGVILSQQNESVKGVTVIAHYPSGEVRATSDEDGNFHLIVPDEPVTLSFEAKNVFPLERAIAQGEAAENLRIKLDFVVPPIHESVVIVSSVVAPSIERRNDTVYREGLFLRDDQVFHTLDAGINAG
jgi:hypothetical protein